MFNNKQKKKKKFLETYGAIKTDHFDFDRISLYYQNLDNSNAFQRVSDRTFNDLDLEDVFIFIDRTSSSPGQQYLYKTLRTIEGDTNHLLHLETMISKIEKQASVSEEAAFILSDLNDNRAYHIQGLFTGKHLSKPNWFPIIPILSISCLSVFLALFYYPPLFLLFLPLAITNFIIHFWNKRNIYSYSNSIPQLYSLTKIALKLIKIGILEADETLRESISTVKQISRKAAWLKFDKSNSDDFSQLGESILELIKATFLIEPVITFWILGKLKTCQREIHTVFANVGKVDVALSISALRSSLPYYCLPEFTSEVRLGIKEVYHPLIKNAVANDLDQEQEMLALITGSNMSGKTTFIRTIGINALLAQTIHTTLAKSFSLPIMKIHSAIRISDDLLESTSYYYEEVRTIKEMIHESEQLHVNLFLLDELFKGTNTYERIASGKAVLSYLTMQKNLVFASTHDLELAILLENSIGIYHFIESIEQNQLHFDYKLKEGIPTITNAISILAINDYPKAITEEAQRIVEHLKK